MGFHLFTFKNGFLLVLLVYFEEFLYVQMSEKEVTSKKPLLRK